MAERCQHVDLESETVCDCPHFVPKVNLTASEVNMCDGCLHSIAWHRIPSQEINATSSKSTSPVFATSTSTGSTSTGSTSTASSGDEILAIFASQAASVGGSAKKTQKKGKKNASEAEARQEAVSGLKRSSKSAMRDTYVSAATIHHIKNTVLLMSFI